MCKRRLVVFFRGLAVVLQFAFFGAGALVINSLIFPCISVFVPKEKQRFLYCDVIHKAWNFFSNVMQKSGSISIDILNFPDALKNPDSRKYGKIIVANHPSFIDIVLLIGLLPKTVCIAKKELKKNLFMGNIVKSLYLINDEDNEKLLKDAVNLLSNGFNIIIFPTGTRTVEGEDMKLHKGAAMMALHSKADIIPVHIHCDYKFLAKHQKIYDAGEKAVKYTLTFNNQININEFFVNNSNLTDIKMRNRLNKLIKENISVSMI